MIPQWMTHLVRARQSQEDTAAQRLAFARRAQKRAHDRARTESDRLESMAGSGTADEALAFVAAAVALQSAAATHAAAVGDAARADAWVTEREQDLITAATSRSVAEQLRDNAQNEVTEARAYVARRELDEAAAAVHERRSRGDS